MGQNMKSRKNGRLAYQIFGMILLFISLISNSIPVSARAFNNLDGAVGVNDLGTNAFDLLPSSQITNQWEVVASMNNSRSWFTVTPLSNGDILVAGGQNSTGNLTSAELYHPDTDTWEVTGSLNYARRLHTANLLPDGRVIVAGGYGNGGTLSSTEIYDPETGVWTVGASMNHTRHFHGSTELPDGKVMVAGGYGSGDLSSAEIYDPTTATWTYTGSLNEVRYWPQLQLLDNGKVLAVGGDGGLNSAGGVTAEIYDPSTGTWAYTDPMSYTRRNFTLTKLLDGRVLATGTALTSEIYDPATSTWSDAGNVNQARALQASALLPDGKVLIAGGYVDNFSVSTNSSEIFDPTDNSWADYAVLNQARTTQHLIQTDIHEFILIGGVNEPPLTYLDSVEKIELEPTPSDDFVITVNTGETFDFTIPTTGIGYNYNVDCDNDLIFEKTAATGDYTCSYDVPGTYTIRIRDNAGDGSGFPHFYLNHRTEQTELSSIDQWGTGKWSSFSRAFYGAYYMNILALDVPDLRNVSDMSLAFQYTYSLDADLSQWDMSQITDMNSMFEFSHFNREIGDWDTSNVTNMSGMFQNSSFNQDIGNWDTGKVVSFRYMFLYNINFNQNIGNWNTSNVRDMQGMFTGYNGSLSKFNQDISGWDTSNVTDMSRMFYNSKFNQDISGWNTQNTTTMSQMFYNSWFDKDISNWNIGSLLTASGMFDGSNLSIDNYDALLNSWSNQIVMDGVSFSAANTNFCLGGEAQSILINDHNWSITDAGKYSYCDPIYKNDFVFTVNTGESTSFTIPTSDAIYNFNVDCDDDGNQEAYGKTSPYVCEYSNPGLYRIRIIDNTGNGTGFPHFYLNGGSERSELISIDQWGTGSWGSFNRSFSGANRLNIFATDVPDLRFVTDMSLAFYGALLDSADLSQWNTSNVENMSLMFSNSKANSGISNWDTGSVTDMHRMFEWSSFNFDLNNWDTSNVKDMSSMFISSQFNGEIGDWDTSSVTQMQDMFYGSKFNQNISDWNTGNVTNMFRMFASSPFNQAIQNWNTSNVTNMWYMFSGSKFNQDISGWDVSNVTDMSYMFAYASAFDQDLSGWDVSSLTTANAMLNNTKFSNENYDKLLTSWSAQAVQDNVTFGAGNATYCAGATGRDTLTTYWKWIITDGGVADGCLQSFGKTAPSNTVSNQSLKPTFTWSAGGTPTSYEVCVDNTNDSTCDGDAWVDVGTDLSYTPTSALASATTYYWQVRSVNDTDTLEANSGTWWSFTTYDDNGDFVFSVNTGSNNKFTIFTNSAYTYNYDLDCENDGVFEFSAIEGEKECGFSSKTATIRIRDNAGDGSGFPAFYLNNNSQSGYMLSIDQWGAIKWQSFANAFYGAANMDILATDTPDLSGVTDMSFAFSTTGLTTPDLSGWDTSTVTKMDSMFEHTPKFNGDITTWDTSNVVTLPAMFYDAASFNQPIGGWNVGKVTNFQGIFRDAKSFNQPINDWDVSSAVYLVNLVHGASAFNQPLDHWDTSNVTRMDYAFFNAPLFDQDLRTWDTANVTTMDHMFDYASAFDQDLSAWDVTSLTTAVAMLNGTKFSNENYDKLLTSWSAQEVQDNVTFGAGSVTYCAGAAGHNSLINSHNWSISDGGKLCGPMVIETIKSTPINNALLLSSIDQLTIEYDQLPLTGNQSGSAESPENYRLVFAGADNVVNTSSCSTDVVGDDQLITIDSVMVETNSPFTATIRVNGGSLLNNGRYRFFACGTGENVIMNSLGQTLNNGVADHILNFQIRVLDLRSPAGTVLASKPVLEFQSIPNAQSYVAEVYQGTKRLKSYTIKPTSCDGVICSFQTTSALTSGNYQWRLRAKVDGVYTPFSDFLTFTVAELKLTAPIGNITTTTPTFSWSEIPGAEGYNLTVKNNLGEEFVIDNPLSTNSYDGLTLDEGSYTWQVSAIIDGVETDPTPESTFTVIDLQTIAPSGTVLGGKPVFEWSNVPNAQLYYVQIYRGAKRLATIKANPTSACGEGAEICNTTYSKTLAPGDYTWQVQVKVNGATTQYTPPMGFTVAELSLIAPVGNITTKTPNFSWSEISGAESYELLIGTPFMIGSINYNPANCLDGTCLYTYASELPTGTYQWQVRVTLDGITSDWTDANVFTIIDLRTIAPSGTVVTRRPVFEWSNVPKAELYSIQIYQGTKLLTTLKIKPSAACSVGAETCSTTYKKDLKLGDHTWRIQVKVNGATTPYTEPMAFTVANMMLQSPELGIDSPFQGSP